MRGGYFEKSVPKRPISRETRRHSGEASSSPALWSWCKYAGGPLIRGMSAVFLVLGISLARFCLSHTSVARILTL